MLIIRIAETCQVFWTAPLILTKVLYVLSFFRTCVRKERPIDHILKGKVMASIFYEVSRGNCS